MSTKKAAEVPAKKAASKVTRVQGNGKPTNRMQPSSKSFDPNVVANISASGAPATAGQKIRGFEGQMYYGVGNAPTGIFANVVEFDFDVKADSIDGTDRSTVGWKDKLNGLLEWTGTIKANSIQEGTDLIAFYNAIVNHATMSGSFRPQDVTGGMAWVGSFVITGFKYASPNSGLQTADIAIEGRGALVLGTVTTGGAA